MMTGVAMTAWLCTGLAWITTAVTTTLSSAIWRGPQHLQHEMLRETASKIAAMKLAMKEADKSRRRRPLIKLQSPFTCHSNPFVLEGLLSYVQHKQLSELLSAAGQVDPRVLNVASQSLLPYKFGSSKDWVYWQQVSRKSLELSPLYGKHTSAEFAKDDKPPSTKPPITVTITANTPTMMKAILAHWLLESFACASPKHRETIPRKIGYQAPGRGEREISKAAAPIPMAIIIVIP